MDERTVAVTVRRAREGDELDPLTRQAYERSLVARGGPALLEQLWENGIGYEDVRDAVARCAQEGHVWVALEDEQIIALALVRVQCVQAIWVTPLHRRRGVATTLLRVLLAGDDAPLDAWALPGDRATKSLYESVGWKARLLTMRGA